MARNELLDERLTYSIIGAFFEVYNYLGYGFLEHVYKAALERELRARGHLVRREVYVLVFYKGEQIGRQRIDMIVDDRVIVEVKSTRLLSPEASRQLHNYLHATTINVGLLLHFGPKANYERKVCTDRSTPKAREVREIDPPRQHPPPDPHPPNPLNPPDPRATLVS